MRFCDLAGPLDLEVPFAGSSLPFPLAIFQLISIVRDLLALVYGPLCPPSQGSVHLAVHPRCGRFGGGVADVNAGIEPGKYQTIVAFGDSFTDGGKHDGSPLLPATLAPGELFAGGRSADGKVWVENLADSEQIGSGTEVNVMDYAISSAVTNLSLWPSNPRPVDFIQQVSTFLSQSNDLDPATTLYTVFFGINDWEDSRIDGNNLPQAAHSLVSQIRLLASPPTNARDFLVTDVYGRGRKDKWGEEWVKEVYARLGELAGYKRSPSDDFDTAFDSLNSTTSLVSDSRSQTIRQAPSSLIPQLNIAFTSFAPIWAGVLGPDPGYRAFGYTSTRECVGDGARICDDPGGAFYWFAGHPSKQTHRIMANYVLEVLEDCRTR
ncbi:hypothetical protein BJ138DRAFT_1173810 [Hygrophoropsis aurantiaca]|uniref:Uncharacterized protein n=1 Tax=Hygrophoropsis aurantiaca TaxID=72124 RepID=A0ACB8A7X8_9AGAM|nr:hypothetical protein BJ138DRAFT_1173810 [Hygrophoropsis aurantiaca]